MSRLDSPEVRQARGSPQPMPDRCGCKLQRTDPPRYCTRWPKHGGNGRCGRFGHHDGTKMLGPDNANFKTGAKSTMAWLSPKVFEAYDAARRDDGLMDLTNDIALLEVVKQEAATGWEAGESLEAWKQLRKTFAQLKSASAKADVDGFKQAVADMDALLASGGRAQAREELGRTLERKGKLVKTRQQLLTDSEELIPAKRVGVVMALLASLVREFIADEQQRREFSTKFAGLLGPRLSPRSQPAPIVDVVEHRAADDSTG